MKVKKLILVSLCAALLMAGCDLFTSFSIDEALGEWDFVDRSIGGKAATGVHMSVMADGTMADVRWDTSENGYLFACDGTLDGKNFTGTYTGWDSMLLGDNEIVTDAAISISYSLSGGKLSASFSGSGPLNGLVLTGGVLSPP